MANHLAIVFFKQQLKFLYSVQLTHNPDVAVFLKSPGLICLASTEIDSRLNNRFFCIVNDQKLH